MLKMILSILLLILSFIAYSIKERAYGRLKWSGDDYSFWGSKAYNRKYMRVKDPIWHYFTSRSNWYTHLFRVKYREAWPTSSTFTVFLTDGFHLSQSIFFLLLSASISTATDWNFLLIWIGILLVNRRTHETGYNSNNGEVAFGRTENSVKPKYVKEQIIKVRNFKIDRTIPKIFIDNTPTKTGKRAKNKNLDESNIEILRENS